MSIWACLKMDGLKLKYIKMLYTTGQGIFLLEQ